MQQRKVSFMKQEVVLNTETNNLATVAAQRVETQVQEQMEQGTALGNNSYLLT